MDKFPYNGINKPPKVVDLDLFYSYKSYSRKGRDEIESVYDSGVGCILTYLTENVFHTLNELNKILYDVYNVYNNPTLYIYYKPDYNDYSTHVDKCYINIFNVLKKVNYNYTNDNDIDVLKSAAEYAYITLCDSKYDTFAGDNLDRLCSACITIAFFKDVMKSYNDIIDIIKLKITCKHNKVFNIVIDHKRKGIDKVYYTTTYKGPEDEEDEYCIRKNELDVEKNYVYRALYEYYSYYFDSFIND